MLWLGQLIGQVKVKLVEFMGDRLSEVPEAIWLLGRVQVELVVEVDGEEDGHVGGIAREDVPQGVELEGGFEEDGHGGGEE